MAAARNHKPNEAVISEAICRIHDDGVCALADLAQPLRSQHELARVVLVGALGQMRGADCGRAIEQSEGDAQVERGDKGVARCGRRKH
eukprot:3881992-Pleurochrysis_carterae.AAC.2